MREEVEPVSPVEDAAPLGTLGPVATVPPPASTPLTGPTWKELQEFISKQTDRDRDLIDKWFKLAASIIAAVFAVAALVIGLVGWKTISDAKATAEEAARAAAKAKIAEVLQEHNIKKLVENTASDLFKNGTYRELIQQQTQSQLKSLHLAARLLDVGVVAGSSPKLEKFKGKQIEVNSCAFDEPMAFATSLVAILRQAGINVKFSRDGQSCQNFLGESIIGTSDPLLFSALDELIFQASDVHAHKVEGPAAANPAAMILISRRTQ
jgi:hypothetical protein